MSGLLLLPYRTARGDEVHWGTWSAELDNSAPINLTDRLPGWDYQSSVTFRTRVGVDWDGLSRTIGVDDSGPFRLVAVVDCPATSRRLVSSLPVRTDGGDAVVSVEVPRGTIAEFVTLYAALVAASDVAGDSSVGGGFRAGARIAQSPDFRVILEGDGSRFPTEAISFGRLGLEPALWSIRMAAVDLDSSFLSSTRLLVNSDIPEAQPLIAGEDGRLLHLLQMDIARQIVGFASEVAGEESLQDDWEGGTIGDTARHLAEDVLDSDLPAVVSLMSSDPDRFERLLQSVFQPWKD